MQFGVFLPHQLPRPWSADSERALFQQSLEQAIVAERAGIDVVWGQEHHFLEEYSHSSAPEVYLAAIAARTSTIRIGYGVMLMPPGFNAPFRCAERVATLDVVSGGRVEWGTGASASRMELDGFGIGLADKRDMWAESVREVARMLALDPYPGYEGRYFSAPARNVVPKPLQRPPSQTGFAENRACRCLNDQTCWPQAEGRGWGVFAWQRSLTRFDRGLMPVR